MADLYASVVGQPVAVKNLRASARRPVHAYLFVGAADTGTRSAALAFAADVLCPSGGCGECVSCRQALAERHPDVMVVERVGASIRAGEIDEVIRLAVRPPSQGAHKVIVLVDFHLVDQQYPRLLKTLEEPPASTVFVVLAEQVPPELVTIASRCVQVEFGALAADVVASALEAEGVDAAVAAEVAAASGGRIERARLLAADPGFAARQAAWRSVPARLDGTGASIAALADELLSSVESVLSPLRERQAAEVVEVDQRIALYGERGSGRKELEERHKREQRRLRADELRFGMASLASVYRDALVAPSHLIARPGAVTAIRALDKAGEALVRNPNETLLLQGLLATLTTASGQ
ncbi:MAG: polymerase subunit delta [Actinomycetota bacterium]|jgi:DNA polymerase-3 subunit delta'|nr:polymerase subunit delta [Actinomycetota bacterium]